ncbi:hypothetical protein HUJ04_011628 [Dendroctonus ponderosae]|nr:hypothetical protein HUJ04_011628 [Dendroctonus ponderosae]
MFKVSKSFRRKSGVSLLFSGGNFRKSYSGEVSLPRQADVVIVGGGIAGCSAFYQLTKRDVKPVLIEHNTLTNGTTWHTGGLVWSLRPNDTDIQLLYRTKEILKNLEQETGVDPGFINNGGIFIARTLSNGRLTSRIRGADQNISQTSSTIHPPAAEASYMNVKPLLEIEQAAQNEASANAKRNEHERRESLMEWFDRSVEKELKNQKTASFDAGPQFPPPLIAVDEPQLNLSKGTLQRMSGATASQVEMLFDLRKEPDTELTDAVDKLAKAEQMCDFAGAIQAAEAAAVAAPPDLVEEAALASARGYQTDVKATRVQGELEGARPIEILGYVGVTKPKYPTKRT